MKSKYEIPAHLPGFKLQNNMQKPDMSANTYKTPIHYSSKWTMFGQMFIFCPYFTKLLAAVVKTH